MIYPRTKVLERRRNVTSLLVRGVPPSEIAQMLEVSRDTIYNDIRVIRSGKNEALYAHTRSEIMAQLYLNALERARFLWRIVEDEEEKGYVKVRALQELRLNDERIMWKLPSIKTPAQQKEDNELTAYHRSLFRPNIKPVVKKFSGRACPPCVSSPADDAADDSKAPGYTPGENPAH